MTIQFELVLFGSVLFIWSFNYLRLMHGGLDDLWAKIGVFVFGSCMLGIAGNALEGTGIHDTLIATAMAGLILWLVPRSLRERRRRSIDLIRREK